MKPESSTFFHMRFIRQGYYESHPRMHRKKVAKKSMKMFRIKIENRKIAYSVIGAALALGASLFAMGRTAFTANSPSSSTLMVASVDEISDQNLLSGTAIASVNVSLVSLSGANTNNASIHVQLLQGGSVMEEAVYHADILHE